MAAKADSINNQVVSAILVEPPTGVLLTAQNQDGTGSAQYAFNMSADSGYKKAMHSTLLSAMSTGQLVRIYFSPGAFAWYSESKHKVNAIRFWK